MAFTLTASPGTDIWRKPPSTDVWNAPHTAPQLRPLSTFRSSRTTFSAKWTKQYDQAGLLLAFYPPSCAPSPSSSTLPKAPKWIKAGLEFYNSSPRISVVACDAWADWSVAPLAGASTETVTVEVVVEHDHHGSSIWIYQVVEGSGERVPLREVCWVTGPDVEDWSLGVAAFGARPATGEEEEKLEVKFGNWDVVWGKE